MLLGHHFQWQFLKKEFELGRLSHAFLFSGPNQIGKRTFAKEFAKFLNCQAENQEQRPCQICPACLTIGKEVHPDVIFLEPIKKEISISQIRELNWKMSLKPYQANLKIAIIDQAHLMSKEGQNAFLKTLEEPRAETFFFLISHYPWQLLPTLLSRLQKIKFNFVPSQEISDFLTQNKKLPSSFVAKITELSAGRPGVALNLAEKENFKQYKAALEDIIKLVDQPIYLKFQYAKELAAKPLTQIEDTLDAWLFYFNSLLTESIKEGNWRKIKKISSFLKGIETTKVLQNFTNTNIRLALENLLLDW